MRQNLLLPSKLSTFGKILRSLLLFLLLILVQIGIQIIFSTISPEKNASSVESYDNALIQSSSFIYVVLLGPLKEELAYRLALAEFDIMYLKISISLILAFIISLVVSFTVTRIGIDYLLLEVTVAIGILIILSRAKFVGLEGWWKKNFGWIAWLSIFLFCVIHLPQLLNYGFDTVTIARAMTGFFVCGIFYTFSRIKFGFLYGVATHALFNLITTLN